MARTREYDWLKSRVKKSAPVSFLNDENKHVEIEADEDTVERSLVDTERSLVDKGRSKFEEVSLSNEKHKKHLLQLFERYIKIAKRMGADLSIVIIFCLSVWQLLLFNRIYTLGLKFTTELQTIPSELLVELIKIDDLIENLNDIINREQAFLMYCFLVTDVNKLNLKNAFMTLVGNDIANKLNEGLAKNMNDSIDFYINIIKDEYFKYINNNIIKNNWIRDAHETWINDIISQLDLETFKFKVDDDIIQQNITTAINIPTDEILYTSGFDKTTSFKSALSMLNATGEINLKSWETIEEASKLINNVNTIGKSVVNSFFGSSPTDIDQVCYKTFISPAKYEIDTYIKKTCNFHELQIRSLFSNAFRNMDAAMSKTSFEYNNLPLTLCLIFLMAFMTYKFRSFVQGKIRSGVTDLTVITDDDEKASTKLSRM